LALFLEAPVRGRKPKPTALKALAGNPGKRPLPDGEPRPDPALPSPPAFLDEEARTEWDRIAPELHKLGLLTHLDRTVLAAYCVSFAVWVRAGAGLSRLLSSPDADGPAIKRWATICSRALRELHMLGSELGLSPASRTRLRVEPPCEADPLAEFLA
jgi:P27 family predicted phage terminase small subunit